MMRQLPPEPSRHKAFEDLVMNFILDQEDRVKQLEEYIGVIGKEVEETLGTPIEVEPLDETQLEDLGLNTCNHDIPLSSMEVPSFDEPEPQPQPLHNRPPLDRSLGEERGLKPPINPHSTDSFRIKFQLLALTDIRQYTVQFLAGYRDIGQHTQIDFGLNVLKSLGWHLEEIHVTWAHLEKKQTRLRLYTKSFEETVHTERGDGVAITKRRRQDFHIDGVTDLATASERDENPIRTHGDYSKPSHEGYMNTIELPKGNNVVPLRSDTNRLVQNGCSFHGLLSEDPNQHLKDFLKLVDSPDLDVANRERTCLHLFQFPFAIKLAIGLNVFLQDPSPHGMILLLNLALYDHEGWNDSKDFVKHVKAISTSQSTSKTPDRRLLELEDQINFLLKGSRSTPRSNSTHVPQAYAEVVSSNPHPRNLNELPKQNPFTFRERIDPYPQPQAFGTTFKARIRDYMAAHTERMERFENAIFKQREEINDRMIEMFGLLKELTASRAPERARDMETLLLLWLWHFRVAFLPKRHRKRIVPCALREEAKHPVTKNVNSISLIKGEEEKDANDDVTSGDSIERPDESDAEVPSNEVEKGNEAENRTKNEPIKSAEEELTQAKKEESVEAPNSQPIGHLYIYPLGITVDILVDVAGYVYPVDFVILDIKEDEKRPFILGTPFLTTSKAMIKFDKGTITLRYGKSKMSFHRIPKSLCKIEKGIKNNIKPIAPTMTMNRLVLEWEERIKLHQEKEMEFDQWRSKIFKNKHPTLVKVESEVNDEGEVTLYLMRRSLEVLRKFHWTILGGRFNQLSHVSSPLLSKLEEY
ncbi:MAK10-like protein [Tanacetum coccineum]